MQKIIMLTEEIKNFLEVFEMFVISQSAKGVADVTIRNYRYYMKNIGNYVYKHKYEHKYVYSSKNLIYYIIY